MGPAPMRTPTFCRQSPPGKASRPRPGERCGPSGMPAASITALTRRHAVLRARDHKGRSECPLPRRWASLTPCTRSRASQQAGRKRRQTLAITHIFDQPQGRL